jgi:sulfonate transport system substrate-binding protein
VKTLLRLIAATLAFWVSNVSAADSVLRVGDQKGASHALMASAGVLDHLPYRIEWNTFVSAQALLEALNAGAIDTGGVGDGPFLFAYAAQSPIKVVSVYHSDTQASVAIVALPDSPLHNAADLKGHTIGTTRGSIGHFLLLKALAKANLTPNDVTIAFLDPGNAKASLVSHSIDAWSTWDPYVALAQIQDHAHIIVDGHGLLSGYGYQAANTSSIATKHAILADFLQRLAKARNWALTHTDVFAAVWAHETGLPNNVAQIVLHRQKAVPVTIDKDVVEALRHTAIVYEQAGAVRTIPDIEAAFDRSFNPPLTR